MAIPGPKEAARRAGLAPCPACYLRDIMKQCARAGAMAKAGTLQQSKIVQAAFIHKCEQNGSEN